VTILGRPGSESGGIAATIVTLAAGTPLAGIVTRLDGWRVRRPLVFWAVVATLVIGTALAIVGGAAATGAPATADPANRSALDALTAASPLATGGTAAAATDTSALLGGSIDPIDLVVKSGLVVVLLFVTLRVLRRVQGGSTPADARIRVIESRTLAAKTQLHLVAIGDRHVLIGATPGRLVMLAELSADDIESAAPATARPDLHLAPAGGVASAVDDDEDAAADGSTFARALGLARAGLDRVGLDRVGLDR